MIRYLDRVGAMIVLGLLFGACGGGNLSEKAAVPVADQPAAAVLPAEGTPVDAEKGSVAVPVVSDRLLSVVIPPCTPLEGVEHDPCSPQLPPRIYTPSVADHGTPSYVTDPPSFADIMSGVQAVGFSPHIVVRATVQPGTARCDGYPLHKFDHFGGRSSDSTRSYWCFADVRVNEYIVGAGPTTLTVGFTRNTFFEDPGLREWPEDIDFVVEYEFGNPAAQIADVYEGRELVLFLNPTMTKTVEAWIVAGHWDTWFVRRDPDTDPPTVTAAFRWERSVVSEVDLDDLVTEVQAAAAARTAAGQTSTARSSSESTAPSTTAIDEFATAAPYLVTRADQLQDFYIAGGAVYEGDDATTVLPPPPPVPPGVPTNVGLSTVDDEILITWDEPESGGAVDDYWLRFESVREDGTKTVFPNSKSWQGENRFEITYAVASFGTEFTVKVRASNTHGYSAWTEEHTFTTPTSTTTSTSS